MDGAGGERQQGEGESASETSDNVGGVRGCDIQSGPAYGIMNEEDDESDEEGGASEEQVALGGEGR